MRINQILLINFIFGFVIKISHKMYKKCIAQKKIESDKSELRSKKEDAQPNI